MELRGLNNIQASNFFGWMDGYCSCFEDMSDGAWQAACEDAVKQFNRTFGTQIDPYEGWMAWVKQNAP